MKRTAKQFTKRFLSIVLTLVMLSTLIVPEVIEFGGSADYARSGISEGSTEIHISTGGQLAQLLVRTWKDKCTWTGKTFLLDNDINMRPGGTTTVSVSNAASSKGQYTGSGTFTRPTYNNSDNGNFGRIDDSWNYCVTFEGVFDGQGHTITGLYGYKNSGGDGKWQGLLFDRLSGTVKNVRFADCTYEHDQDRNNTDSSLGLIGGVTTGGVVENVILESSVTLICHRTATNNYLDTVGGIAGWVDGGTLRNCTSFVTIISANGQGSTSYPFSGTAKIQVGGIAGAIESTSTVINCLGYGTYYTNVTAREFMGVTESYANPGWHQVCPAKLGNDGDKTLRNNIAGVNSISEWTYRQFYYDAAGLPDWYDFSGTYTLTTQAQLIEFFRMLEKGMRFWGETVKLGNTIYLNPGSNLNLYVSNGKIAFPSAPSNTFRVVDTLASGSGVRCFEGTFDGQGYAIDGFYGTTSDATDVTGMFGAMVGDNSGVKPAIKNLVVQNSYIQRVNDSAGQMGGLIGTCRGSVTVQNCLLDLDLAYRGNNAYYIGSVCRSGGTGAPGSVTFSNVVNAGTTVAAASSSSIAVTTTYSGCRVGFLYHNASDVTGTATDCLNMGVCYVSSSMGASDGGGYSNCGNANSKITKTRMQGSWTKNPVTQGDHYKQTSTPGGTWYSLPYFESYVPSGVYNLAGIAKDAAISSYSNNYTEGSSFTVTSAADLNTMVTKINADSSSRGNGRLFKITADLTFNSNNNMYMKSTWASGATITVPAYQGANGSSGNFVRFTDFWGTLDGQAHKISGLFARRVATNSSFDGGLFYKLGGTVKNLAIVNSFLAGDHTAGTNGTAYTNASGVEWGGLAGEVFAGTVIDNCYFDYDCLLISNYGTGDGGGYGYITAKIQGATVIRNVTCAGRFVTCKTNMTNTVASGTCPCGVIAGNGGNANYGVQVTGLVFSGYRSTAKGGSAGTNSVNWLVHWTNGGVSLSGIYYSEGTPPTADGSTYVFAPGLCDVVLKANADKFTSTSYTLKTFAQTSGSTLRIIVKVSKAQALNATEVGFRLTRGDTNKKATVKLYNVYSTITAAGVSKAASEVDGKGDYIYAMVITNFPSGVTLTIEPYVKTSAGTYYASSSSFSR